LGDLGDETIAATVARWTDARHTGDVDAMVTMLTDDAHYSMPPLPQW